MAGLLSLRDGLRYLRNRPEESQMIIAVLNNEIHVVQLIERLLKSAGHDVRIFATENTFSREFARETFALVIAGPTDSAPDGWEVLALLREQSKSPVPVICMVKKDDEGLIVTALNAGADDCMCMPLRSKEFLARVNAVTRVSLPRDH